MFVVNAAGEEYFSCWEITIKGFFSVGKDISPVGRYLSSICWKNARDGVFFPFGLLRYFKQFVSAWRQLAENFTSLKKAVDQIKRLLLPHFMPGKCAKRRFVFCVGLLRYYDNFVTARRQVAETTGLEIAVNTVIGKVTRLRDNYSRVTYDSIMDIFSELRKPHQKGGTIEFYQKTCNPRKNELGSDFYWQFCGTSSQKGECAIFATVPFLTVSINGFLRFWDTIVDALCFASLLIRFTTLITWGIWGQNQWPY